MDNFNPLGETLDAISIRFERDNINLEDLPEPEEDDTAQLLVFKFYGADEEVVEFDDEEHLRHALRKLLDKDNLRRVISIFPGADRFPVIVNMPRFIAAIPIIGRREHDGE